MVGDFIYLSAMTGNELRIGNYVDATYSSEPHKITAHDLLHYERRDKDVSHLCEWNALTPIPLTKEWLVKFGFEKRKMDVGNGYYLSGLSIYSDISSDGFFQFSDWDEGKIPIPKYVHQLQNLYFALTQTELELK